MRHDTHSKNNQWSLDLHGFHLARPGFFLIAASLMMAACGEDGDSVAPQCINSEVTEARPDVDFIVESPLPPELGVSCLQGADLEAFLVIPGSESCTLVITQAEARGCCPDYPTNQSVQADIYFRRGSDGTPLGSQTKLVSLPEITTPSISLSFENIQFDPGNYDLDGDGTLNIDEYCDGSL